MDNFTVIAVDPRNVIFTWEKRLAKDEEAKDEILMLMNDKGLPETKFIN